MTVLVLTTDELRAAAKVSGSAALAAMDGGWADEDLAVANVVALRGLQARGLATVRQSDAGVEVVLTAAVCAALRPLLGSDVAIEVIRETPSGAQRWLIGQAGAATMVAEEREPDIWSLSAPDLPATRVAARIAAELTAELPTDLLFVGTVATIPTPVLIAAERRASRDESAAGIIELVDAGLSDADAATVAAILTKACAFVTVRRVSHGDGLRTVHGLTWLEAGTCGTWLAIPTRSDGPDDHPAADLDHQHVDDLPYPDELDPVTELRAVGPADIRAELAELLDAELADLAWTDRVTR
jgi:hypothetical protein